MTHIDELLERYPADLERGIELATAHHQWLSSTYKLPFLASSMVRWPTRKAVTVAFLGGTDDLHAAIADTVEQITANCGITIDCGRTSGGFRRWSTLDSRHRADIRVSFDLDGFWSLVGTASIDDDLMATSSRWGGAPHQSSLNLAGFDRQLRNGWQRIVLRHFLHALAFSRGPQRQSYADQELRWNDEPGYVTTRDGAGRFVEDGQGRRPGVYTVLSGGPNFWSRAIVDAKLRATPGVDPAAPDRESVIHYRLDPALYGQHVDRLRPSTPGNTLSPGDVQRLQMLYPSERHESAEACLAAQAKDAARRLQANGALRPGLARVLDRWCC